MALSSAFVMFRRLGMSFLRHSIFPLFECRCQVNSLSPVIVPAPAPDPSANTLLRAAGPLEHKQRERVGRPVNPGSAKRNLMLGWAIAFFIVALIAGGLGFGIVSGTAFAAAKIIFVLALLAFLISAVVEVARRGAP